MQTVACPKALLLKVAVTMLSPLQVPLELQHPSSEVLKQIYKALKIQVCCRQTPPFCWSRFRNTPFCKGIFMDHGYSCSTSFSLKLGTHSLPFICPGHLYPLPWTTQNINIQMDVSRNEGWSHWSLLFRKTRHSSNTYFQEHKDATAKNRFNLKHLCDSSVFGGMGGCLLPSKPSQISMAPCPILEPSNSWHWDDDFESIWLQV